MFENLGFDCQVCVPNTTIIFHVQTHIFLHLHLKKSDAYYTLLCLTIIEYIVCVVSITI
jgi:hypothetical protein